MLRKLTTLMGIATVLGAGAVTFVTLSPFKSAHDGNVRMVECSETQAAGGQFAIVPADDLAGQPPQQPACAQSEGRAEAIASL